MYLQMQSYAAEHSEAFERAVQLFSRHPVLSAKTDVVSKLLPQNPDKVKATIEQFKSLLESERMLWQSVQIRPVIAPGKSAQDLDDLQRRFITDNAAVVRRLTGKMFDDLMRTVVTHEAYLGIDTDYASFVRVADAAHILHSIDSHLDRQEVLATRVLAYVPYADVLHMHIADLQASMNDQHALVAKLPEFTFRE